VADEAAEVYDLSPETKAMLEKKKVNKSGRGCFLCSLILKDVEKHDVLTDYPFDLTGKGQFPVKAKLDHVTLEKGETPKQEAKEPKK
jgi:hypothetical protein